MTGRPTDVLPAGTSVPEAVVLMLSSTPGQLTVEGMAGRGSAGT